MLNLEKRYFRIFSDTLQRRAAKFIILNVIISIKCIQWLIHLNACNNWSKCDNTFLVGIIHNGCNKEKTMWEITLNVLSIKFRLFLLLFLILKVLAKRGNGVSKRKWSYVEFAWKAILVTMPALSIYFMEIECRRRWIAQIYCSNASTFETEQESILMSLYVCRCGL